MNVSDIQYGASSFTEIRELNALYVDKTERIYDLISSNTRRLFLSRPRRFGKTLLVSIMEQIFKGNKELFKGLAIYDKDYDWKEFPVIRINLSDCDSSSKEELEEFLCGLTEKIAINKFGFDITNIKVRTPRSCLSALFECFQKKDQKVVVLIDEYDYPVISNIANPKVANELREILRNFYAVLKANSENIHFEFLTGVTKLAYTTIFSGVNDVKDISSSEKFADLLGYTQVELEQYFNTSIEMEVNSKGLSRKEFLNEIKVWYDGYRFSKKDIKVYNPSSINIFFQENCDFSVYWITTGTPSFLIEVLSQENEINLDEQLKDWYVDFLEDNVLIIPNFDILNLLYQSGYITISDYDPKTNAYKLNYPNREVAKSFNTYLIEAIFKISKTTLKSKIKNIVDSLEANNVESFIDNLNKLLKSIASTPQKYHENAFQLVLVTILGYMTDLFEVQAEQTGFSGRSDVTVISKTHIYIIELKLDKKADVGMKQIKEKEYYFSYLNDDKYKDKRVTLISLSFDSNTKEIIDYLIENVR